MKHCVCPCALIAILLVITAVALLFQSSNTMLRGIQITPATAVEDEPSQSYFSICAIGKEEPDIVEWIEYHRRMGCSKFYIFDHNSSMPMLESIQEYVNSGVVAYKFDDFKGNLNPQLHVYRTCLREYGSRHRFMGMLDMDEFVVVVDKKLTIPDVLRSYESYGGLALQWMMYGSSGHIARPAGGVLANYHHCGKNQHIKTIVNTQYVNTTTGDPHHFTYREGYHAVDTSGRRVDGPFNLRRGGEVRQPPPHVYEVMYINHYNIKSREDFERKRAKGRACNSNMTWTDYFERHQRDSSDECGYLEMPPAARVDGDRLEII